ncbi:Hypothetical_protein [Hexamita inflata]|uniref:Hypothetical_protein n=1 Tax=Hexamita inflata TaxID=28002 RepID=A0AA86NCW6_9EUKA|nr:Hypothetical protein HINF_LOCUS4369 [Hexamita inflata]CAI9916726.1 Hypothetical protein HINF_LOCUS4371 [Hexamita inflata]CAI9916728.1 Hypothetical protein HINF_LOCUS4373 [Hexamita inflata]
MQQQSQLPPLILSPKKMNKQHPKPANHRLSSFSQLVQSEFQTYSNSKIENLSKSMNEYEHPEDFYDLYKMADLCIDDLNESIEDFNLRNGAGQKLKKDIGLVRSQLAAMKERVDEYERRFRKQQKQLISISDDCVLMYSQVNKMHQQSSKK